MEKNDEQFIKEYLDGNQDSFKVLIDKYTPSLYNFSAYFVGRDYANDIVQDVFIKIWRNIKKFDHTKASFKTWIFTITRNTVTDYLRKKKMVNFSAIDKEEEKFEDSIEDDAILPDEVISKLENKEFLDNMLNQIPYNYKEILILYYQEELTFNEIGKMLGKPLNTVKSYHRRALILLREMVAPKS